MTRNRSIAGSVVLGVLLGLVVVAGWFFFPQIEAVFKATLPRVKEKMVSAERKVIPAKLSRIDYSREKAALEDTGDRERKLAGPKAKENNAKEAFTNKTPTAKESIAGNSVCSEKGKSLTKPGDLHRKERAESAGHKIPATRQNKYAFWKFDKRKNAQAFVANIQKQTGIELLMGREGFEYVVYIPAADSREKTQKADVIKRVTGISKT